MRSCDASVFWSTRLGAYNKVYPADSQPGLPIRKLTLCGSSSTDPLQVISPGRSFDLSSLSLLPHTK